MKKIIYKITINNWHEYNAKSKPNMPSIFVSKRFFDDVKIQSLPSGGKLLWLGLLLRRGDHVESFYEASHEDLVRFAGGSGHLVESLLLRMQSLQLLTYEKTPPNRIEKNRIEENIKEKKVRVELEKVPSAPTVAPTPEPPKLISIWNDNCGRLAKVKVSNAKRNKLISTRWKELDELQWLEVVKRLSDSDFCNGKNDRGWKADFDFLLKPDTAAKVLEGRYDNRDGVKNGMTDEGLYLTNAQKISHNNLTLFKKLQGNANEKPTERDAKPSVLDGGISPGGHHAIPSDNAGE